MREIGRSTVSAWQLSGFGLDCYVLSLRLLRGGTYNQECKRAKSNGAECVG